MKVYWTDHAKKELRAIHAYIAQNSLRYAQGIVDRITRKTKLLRKFPLLGAEVAEYEDDSIRELLEYPFRIIYQVGEDRVDIVSVVHGARQLPPSPP